MCIISDRHSGIIRAVRDVFPRPHRHRFCIRHIVANLKKRYSVKDLNKMVWRCASAETVAHYDHEMQKLEEACPGAKAELTEDMSPEQWALAYDGNMSFGKLTTYLVFVQRLPAICVEGRRIWLSRTPLICFEIVELHVPDRVTPPEDVEHVTRISRKVRAGEDWTLYHRDYIARWEARADWVCMRAWLASVNHRAALYPSSTDPHWLEIGQYSQSVLHSLPLLEGAIVGGDESHAGEPSYVGEPARERAPRQRRARRRPTAQERRLRVEDYDEVPAVPESTVLHLPRERTPDTEPSPPFEQPLEQPQEEPSRHPPIRRIYTRRQKKAIGAPEPSSAL
ncbi:hypothetical protein H6P81_003131 [Aristolochia fimbriata]|uniref:MULE transposase domain-containing protein n=1 Tax=Aristolochia fimbriata TaxID=158543 RepID=A0AAV7FCH2_ARIFI|nr:hypothetical protein H6P81_003131 [Aristolochia fimbriata]